NIRPKRCMTEKEFLHIIEEIRPYTKYVYFHIKGEPLMHPLLGRFLDICKDAAIQVQLTTNGTLLAQTKDLLCEKSSLRQINISLHSFGEHDSIDMDHYLSTALEFAKTASLEHQKYVVLRLWNLDENRNSDPESIDMMKRIQLFFPGHENLKEQMSDHRSVLLDRGIFISWEQKFEWPSLQNSFVSAEGICHGTRSMLGILADGTIVPCCLDANGEAPLGNIFKHPFSSIVEGTELKSIAGNFTNQRIILPLCQKCSYRTRFNCPDPRLLPPK
ncbi:MAG: SPASM domain-containing protein, partial [Oscillospiraceae bacterium]